MISDCLPTVNWYISNRVDQATYNKCKTMILFAINNSDNFEPPGQGYLVIPVGGHAPWPSSGGGVPSPTSLSIFQPF